MMPRAFFGLSSAALGATGVLLLAAAWNGHHPLGRGHGGSAAASACPYLNAQAGDANEGGPAQDSIRAYAAIEAALADGSLRGVPENAARIARFFGEVNPEIAESARRLGRLRALPAVRAEFRRLTDLFSRAPDGNAPAEREGETSRRLLEI